MRLSLSLMPCSSARVVVLAAVRVCQLRWSCCRKRTRDTSGRWRQSAAGGCWAVSRLCLPGPDLQRVQDCKADLLSDSEFGPALIPHDRHPWEALLGHGDTARPARHRLLRWHKDIRQANDII